MTETRRSKGRVAVRLAAFGIALSLLSGCIGAMAAPLLTTAGVTAATNTSLDRTFTYSERVTRMSCSQLRSEYARLEQDAVARVNPLGNWSARRAAVLSAAGQRGCRITG